MEDLQKDVLEICKKCNLENFNSIEKLEQNSICLKKEFKSDNLLEIRIGRNYYNKQNYDFMLIRENQKLDQISEKEFENLTNSETENKIKMFLNRYKF
jgi:hypothetical protein